MRETVTSGWRVRKPKAVARLDSPLGLGQSSAPECDSKTWPSAVAVGDAGGVRLGAGLSRAALVCFCVGGAGSIAGRGCRPGGVATFRLGFFGGVGLSISFAAVSVEHPAHGRGDRRLAGIERERGVFLGSLGLAMWRLVSLRFGGSKLAVDQAVLFWPVCRCGVGGDRDVSSPGAGWVSVEFSGRHPV